MAFQSDSSVYVYIIPLVKTWSARLEEAVALLTSSISHKCAKRGIRGVLTTSPLASSGAQGPKHVEGRAKMDGVVLFPL